MATVARLAPSRSPSNAAPVSQRLKQFAHAALSRSLWRWLKVAKSAATGKASLVSLVDSYCVGRGIEIGPGLTPYCSPRNTLFLDKRGDPDILADSASIPVADGSIDFLFSAHCLEHSQNTILTLNEWIRVLRPGGVLFLILPHGDRTFDRYRAKTTLEHHIADFETLTAARDRSHIPELTSGWTAASSARDLADYEREWGADPWDWDFRFDNDLIHFHVWTQDEMVRLLQYLGLSIAYVDEQTPDRPDSFVVVARKH